MPILIFVMTMLMIFALLAYGRLETFRNFAGMQGEFIHYVEKRERNFINEQAKIRYDNIIANEDDEERARDQRSLASPILSLYLLINKKGREMKAAEFEQSLLIAKNLLTFLYSDSKFYMEISNKRPDFISELLHSLVQATEDAKIVENKDLSNIKLGDPVLDDAIYKMLKGESPVVIDKFKPVQGYPSLLDFITVKNKINIRIYLASPQLLMAIFGDPSTVEQIINERKQIFKMLDKDKEKQLDKKQLEVRFSDTFIEKRLPGINNTMLNFEVSRTNPAKYE